MIDPAIIERERIEMPDELFRQEWECDWSAANVGAILGRYVEQADKDGRIDAFDRDRVGRVIVSCDIGHRDAAAWWWWEERPDGWLLFDHDEASGLDVDDWLGRHAEHARVQPDVLVMPHDARSKSFATKRSPLEAMLAARWAKSTMILPNTRIPERINAARVVLRRCRFARVECMDGLNALREWHYKWDEDRKTFSAEPDHDWSSHSADAFTYGAQFVAERVVDAKAAPVHARPLSSFTMDEAWATTPTRSKDGF
jgi:hypothetical protein